MKVDNNAITERIKSSNLKVTKIRVIILQYFLNSKHALSYSDIDLHLKGKEDKATIYRTLKSFFEKGIIHEVFDGEKTTKYALCGINCSVTKHQDYHAHFKCTSCNNTYCLDKPSIEITLPTGYISNTFNLVVEGFCLNCN